MVVNLEFGRFVIASRSGGKLPVGVNLTKPAFQDVYVGAPVHFWKFRKVGHNKYLLSVDGYPYTGVIDGKVTASVYLKHEVVWEIAHQEYHNAYTISPADDSSVGWTTIEGTGKIGISPIKATHSIPPQFSSNQLFSFELFKE